MLLLLLLLLLLQCILGLLQAQACSRSCTSFLRLLTLYKADTVSPRTRRREHVNHSFRVLTVPDLARTPPCLNVRRRAVPTG